MKLIGLILTVLAVKLVVQRKEAVATWIGGAATGQDATTRRDGWAAFRNGLAKLWHGVTIAFLIVLLATWVLDIPGGFGYLARASGTSLLTIAIAVNRAIDKLPDTGRGGFGTSETLWARSLAGSASTEGRRLAGQAYGTCQRKAAAGLYYSLRNCLIQHHDDLTQGLNENYWQSRAGS